LGKIAAEAFLNAVLLTPIPSGVKKKRHGREGDAKDETQGI
jgi:hypothetical protein